MTRRLDIRLSTDPADEPRKKVRLPSGVEVEIVMITPESDPELWKQWEELKKTGIGPNDPDF